MLLEHRIFPPFFFGGAGEVFFFGKIWRLDEFTNDTVHEIAVHIQKTHETTTHIFTSSLPKNPSLPEKPTVHNKGG